MTKPQDTSIAAERSLEMRPRKTYQKPELQVYGDLAEITQTATGSKASDGGGNPNMHYTS